MANQELLDEIIETKQIAADSEEKLREEILAKDEVMKIAVHEECEKIKDSINSKYDGTMTRHTEIINDMVERRKKELAESQFLYDRASANVSRYDKRMSQID